MKKIATLLTICLMHILSANVWADSISLDTFKKLSAALEKGEHVHVLYNFDLCQPQGKMLRDSKTITNVKAGDDFLPYNSYPIKINGITTDIIATSHTVRVEHSSLGYIEQYIRLRVFEDNHAELYSASYDPKTFQKLASHTYICKIYDGGVRLLQEK